MTSLGRIFIRSFLRGALGLCLLLNVASAGSLSNVIPLRDIQPGMTGYGLTVFAGDQVDTFGVTVIGIQDRSRIGGSLILVEVTGHDLETSGIAQGMSGSPIFLAGRLAGALAFGWGGALKPIAGVTPAAEMLTLPTEPGKLADSVTLTGSRNSLALMMSRGGAEVAAALGWRGSKPLAAGNAPDSDLWPDAAGLLQNLIPGLNSTASEMGLPVGWFQRLPGEPQESTPQGGGGSRNLVPGAACAIPLVMGDALLGVIGTTTWVQGDDVFMMGHPFLQRGPVRWPLATAEVLTILPSRQMSFKMAGVGQLVGTVFHDQRPGLTGRLGPVPHMIPITTRVTAKGQEQSYAFQIVDDFALTPPLAFWCLYNSLLVRGDDASQQTVHYRVTTQWDGDSALAAEPLVLSGVAVGPGGVQGLASAWMAPISLLLNNSDHRLTLTSLDAELTVERPAAMATIAAFDAASRIVVGQGPLRCTVRLQPQRGTAQSMVLSLDLPDYLAPGTYRLVAASEADLFALEAQRLGARPPMDTLADLVHLLRQPRAADRLVVALVAPGGGLVLSGREMPELPGSKARLLAAVQPGVGSPMAELPARVTTQVAWALSGSQVKNLVLVPGANGFAVQARP